MKNGGMASLFFINMSERCKNNGDAVKSIPVARRKNAVDAKSELPTEVEAEGNLEVVYRAIANGVVDFGAVIAGY